jgi:hypothetical protein
VLALGNDNAPGAIIRPIPKSPILNSPSREVILHADRDHSGERLSSAATPARDESSMNICEKPESLGESAKKVPSRS